MVSKELINKTFTDIIAHKCGGSVKVRELGATARIFESENYTTISYANGFELTFSKNRDSDFGTMEEFESIYLGNGDVRRYLGNDSYGFFDYQRDWIIDHYGIEEWEFVCKYSDMFASSDGMDLNTDLRDGNNLGDYNFLRREHDHYISIVKNVPCDNEDCVSLRVMDNLHDNDALNRRIVYDKAHTSSSMGMNMDEFGSFADVMDCWRVFTLVDKDSGATGLFYGNPLMEVNGFDWEKELHFLPKQRFERVLIDEENKIIIQRPQVKGK